MFGRPQVGASGVNNQHQKNDQTPYKIFEVKSTVPKPKTRRGGVKVRARAARRAQRLALEEEQRKANARRQANAEAAQNISRFRGMQNALQGQQNAAKKAANQATTGAAESTMSFGRMQNAAHENNTIASAEDNIECKAKTTYLGELEGLEFEMTAKRENEPAGELDLEVAGGGFVTCVCDLLCVCETPQCMCADGCLCD
jgi:hypothetical protein